jgi:hypothetical protein
VKKVLGQDLTPWVLVLLTVSCGGKSPGGPTPMTSNLGAPMLSSPAGGAEVDSLRPSLTVDNVASSAAGAKNYDFQVSTGPDFLTGLITKTAVPEGSGGQTIYGLEQDLQVAMAYYWRARATQGTTTGAWSSPASFRTRTRRPPLVTVVTGRTRVDSEEMLTIRADVAPGEAPLAQLTFEWSAEIGAFTGTGAEVRWTAPRAARPQVVNFKVTVVDKFTVTNSDGTTTPAENRVNASAPVQYNDSVADIRGLVSVFVDDFAHSNVPAEVVVRNFSDNCPGKQEELEDIRLNRERVTVQSFEFLFRDARFNADRTMADTTSTCNFVSTVKATGKKETATGTCLINAVYESPRWYLCDSRYSGTTTTALRFWE